MLLLRPTATGTEAEGMPGVVRWDAERWIIPKRSDGMGVAGDGGVPLFWFSWIPKNGKDSLALGPLMKKGMRTRPVGVRREPLISTRRLLRTKALVVCCNR